MTLTAQDFPKFYHAAYGYEPFPWQARLAERVWSGDWPRAIALPTAAGKTTCLDIAVFALAGGATGAARRIFFVVDRRIVVDQAFEHAKALAGKLRDATGGILKAVADSLREVAGGGTDAPPLDFYALRGGMYRETAWARSPLQPTIIASTVDQVGSRLLFRGYGVSDGMKPVHAGLVGNDALILLDEAHCAKPFDQTIQAVRHYRTWNESPAPFHFVSVTATPTENVPEEQIERDDDADRDHAVLGKRIKAKKPARLVVAAKATGKNWRKELVAELEKQARELAKDAACVGIIVNRVAAARELKAKLGADTVLLTGRMRPLDRDRLFDEKLRPLLSNATGTPPQFVIGTQALEVGADFDFHALVTECASLDALRQRFGRLNRVAARTQAPAVVVVRADQTEPADKEKDADPVYGNSLPNTWQWLTEGGRAEFDFGVSAVREATRGVDLAPLNAPSPNAPVLFPVHLDCWVQTSPKPEPDPDPAPFLHGPTDPGQPDVQVVFRDDLGENPEAWAAVVARCPPSSSEAVPVPMGLFRKWLRGEPLRDESADVEGGPVEKGTDEAEKFIPRRALLWAGPEQSEPVSGAAGLRKDGVYVVPCQADAADQLGDFPFGLTDYAEPAFLRSRDRAVFRLPDSTIDPNADDFEDQVTAAVEAWVAADPAAWPPGAIDHLTQRKRRTVEPYPEPLRGFIVTGKRRLFQFDPTYLDDTEPGESSRGREPVTLAAHSAGVADHAGRFAAAVGLPADLYRAAGFWHDLGKLDARFQKLLRGYAAGEPLAKSGSYGTRPWESHRYPTGARHELLSAALLARCDDLFLHLIATHHGRARPFAPPVADADAAVRTVRCEWFGRAEELARQDVAAWNAELPGRFWRVVRAYGWWGAAYREAVFRLADHAQSAAEQEEQWAPGEKPPPPPAPPRVPPAEPRASHPLVLSGLDGANPLGFLAALGTLRLASEMYPGTTMHWEQYGNWRPVLTLPDLVEPEAFCTRLHTLVHRVPDPKAAIAATSAHKAYRELKKRGEDALKGIKSRKLRGEAREAAVSAEVAPHRIQEAAARKEWLQALERAVPAPFLSLGQSINVTAEEFAGFAGRTADRLHASRAPGRADADFAPAFGTEACVDRFGKVVPTEFQLINGSGHQFFLTTWGSLMAGITTAQLVRSLFGTWTYSDPGCSFRWDPTDDVRYAVRWGDPSPEGVHTEHGANLLAAFGLPLFPTVPTDRGPRTTGFMPSDDEPILTWPVWDRPVGVDVIRSYIQSPHLHARAPGESLRAIGIVEAFRVRKFEVGKPPLSKLNFRPAVMA